MADTVSIWEMADSSIGGGSWKTTIFCTRRKDGSFSLRLRSIGEEGTLWPAGITRIKSPELFVKALIEMGNLINYKFDSEEIANEICVKLHNIDHKFSQEIRAHVGKL